MDSVTLAVLNYNGVHHLDTLLPTLLSACQKSPVAARPIVLDNGSTNGDLDWLRARYHDVAAVSAPRNDFLFSYNWLLERLEDRWVVLLNNDLRVREDFVAPLLQHFDAPDVFSVSACSLDWEGARFTCGPAALNAHHGIYNWGYDTERQQVSHTLFTSGGFMAVDRLKFLELGGFNRLFYPAYGEDLDLCFRAWRRGWRCIFEPASVVYHRENGTFAANSDNCATRLMFRCQLLFQWASLPAAATWSERAAFQALCAWRHLLAGNPAWAGVWIKTFAEWLRLRKSYLWMKTPRRELDEIVRRINAPVVPKGQTNIVC